jgi:hypothetical protein
MLMSGGGNGDPNAFDEAEIFSTRRITVAPIVVLIGYLFVVYAILKKSLGTERANDRSSKRSSSPSSRGSRNSCP